MCERAVRIQELALRPNHPLLARSMMYLAMIDAELGLIDEACRLFDGVIAINQSCLSIAHPRATEALLFYGPLLSRTGQYARSRLTLEGVTESYKSLFGPDDPRLACLLSYLADLAADMGDFPAAGRLFDRAVEIFRAGPNPRPGCDDVYERQADFLARTGHSEEAVALYQQQLEYWEGTEGPESPDSSAERWASWRSFDTGRATYPASALYQRALAIRTLSSGRLHPEVADLQFGLALVSADSSKYDAAMTTASGTSCPRHRLRTGSPPRRSRSQRSRVLPVPERRPRLVAEDRNPG